MIKWLKPLYTGTIPMSQTAAMMAEAETYDPKKFGDCRIIILSTNEKNLFEILSFHQLAIPYYQSLELRAVGLAQDMESAKELLKEIIEDMIRKNADYDVRAFFSEQ